MSKKLSRRQFLTYTLGGTAGFLASGMLFPMVRFAIDPVLKKGDSGGFVETTMTEAELTNSPKAVQFTVHVKDGWYEPPKGETKTAWVYKDNNGKVVALSPICKHLGCTVNWNSNPQFKNEFFCPCHFGRYYKDGTNVPGTPPAKPLDKYKTQIKNGRLLIGPLEKV
ncbi:ubiquinol-cytochrome c reductase iron-sulfur subunit [Paenactinomyces guangxiensis]|uniref:QcrA and Rieske domain-containing protein n=1 Tax=Paenactinomyces guangxiensis TaxID=1490290 RepID=UPI002867E738|nr:ubiquinol-cytochrome c reductase iron-sulfur subunit [Paenactinomyces guangxiensis]